VAKYARNWNEKVYRRYIQEGRGQGQGFSYKPWLTVRDFPSLGMVSRIKGDTTGRIHHLMSNHETNLFFLLDWSDNVLDIREQYPLLDISDAINIAEKAKIRYPFDKISGFPYVLTSDFYIETPSGGSVLSVKPTSELNKPRVLEKLEIERRYWLSKGVKWELVTEREINNIKAKNIEWLSQARNPAHLGVVAELWPMLLDFFRNHLDKAPIIDICKEVERYFGLSDGIGLNAFRYLAYKKQISLEIDQPIESIIFTQNKSAYPVLEAV